MVSSAYSAVLSALTASPSLLYRSRCCSRRKFQSRIQAKTIAETDARVTCTQNHTLLTTVASQDAILPHIMRDFLPRDCLPTQRMLRMMLAQVPPRTHTLCSAELERLRHEAAAVQQELHFRLANPDLPDLASLRRTCRLLKGAMDHRLDAARRIQEYNATNPYPPLTLRALQRIEREYLASYYPSAASLIVTMAVSPLRAWRPIVGMYQVAKLALKAGRFLWNNSPLTRQALKTLMGIMALLVALLAAEVQRGQEGN